MTRKEAIWYLQPIADSASLERYKEALGMAIAALREQETVTNRNGLTNADHIRSMTDEALAEFLCDATYQENEQGYPIMRTVNKVWWRNWLKQPYEEDSTC